MGFFCGVQPNLAADFVVADDAAHTRMENFRATAGAGIYAGFFHAPQRFFDGDFRDAREIVDFNHRERFEMYAGTALLQAANHFQKIFERQIGMQSANNVEFGCAFANALLGALINFFEGVSVGARRVGVAAERTQLAMRHADVGRIDVTVDVEIGDVAVLFFADVVGEPADREQVGER